MLDKNTYYKHRQFFTVNTRENVISKTLLSTKPAAALFGNIPNPLEPVSE